MVVAPVSGTHVSLPAPAKLNLFLNVLNRRPDGYHNLQTVFQFIDFADRLDFHVSDNSTLSLEAPNLDIPPEDNLILRAAKLLKESTQTQQGAHIHLHKVLPIGGGIGGGSSNAATTLVGLNRLWKTGLSQAELMQLGGQLGADVPIFIHGQSAYATGTGDELSPIDIDEPWYLLLFPPVSVMTAQLFSHPQLTRNNQAITISTFLNEGGPNSIEPLVKDLYPEVAHALDWLSQFGSAKMSGTGSTVFARFEDKALAESILNQVPTPFKGLVTKGCNRSPLYS